MITISKSLQTAGNLMTITNDPERKGAYLYTHVTSFLFLVSSFLSSTRYPLRLDQHLFFISIYLALERAWEANSPRTKHIPYYTTTPYQTIATF